MSKINTLYNYFTSPKTVKQKDNKDNKDNKVTKTETPGTPKSGRKNKEQKKIEEKENRQTDIRKRNWKNEESDDNEEIAPVQTKRRRIIIPDDSEDSGDSFKPDSADEDSESELSEGVTESEIETQEEETPEKKPKKPVIAKGSRKEKGAPKRSGKKEIKSITASQSQEQSTTVPVTPADSWPHLKYDFLQPNKRRDINRRPPTDPNYDSKTVYVPLDFLNNQTPAMRQWWEIKSKHFDCVLFFKVGKFYELYHMDAVTGVNELNLTYMRVS